MDVSDERDGSVKNPTDSGSGVSGDGFSNAEITAALEASRTDFGPSEMETGKGNGAATDTSHQAVQDTAAATGATKDGVPGKAEGDDVGAGRQDGFTETGTIAFSHAKDTNTSKPERTASITETRRDQSAQDVVCTSAAGFKAAADESGNDIQGKAGNAQADTDVIMVDDAPEEDTGEAAETNPPRRGRKRGAPGLRKGKSAPDSTSSRPTKVSKKSQLTPEVANMNTSDNNSEQVDSVTADGGGDHSSAAAESAPVAKEPRRSGRRATRKSKTYAEEDSDAEFNPAPTHLSKESVPSDRTSQPKRGGGSRIWTPDHLLQDPKSKLVKADLMAILRDPRAWTSLLPTQQSKIISMFPNAPALAPDPSNPTAPLPDIPQQMLASNSAFRADISMFQEDLSQGRLDPGWQNDGLVAMERRARGEFDAWKEKEVEAFWGQKQKLSYDVLAGESSKIKLDTLVAGGCWEVGDVWVYSKGFGKGKHTVKIEKEATITSITPDNRITFRFPDGQRKFSSETAGKDIETEPLDALPQLADKLVETDGRVGTWRHSNVWKDIRCFRKNQDIGSLWEIREIYWARQQEETK